MKFKTLDDVLELLTDLSECLEMRLYKENCEDLRDAAAFLKEREMERRSIPGHGHQPLPTGRHAGPPPSGSGAGRR